VSLFGSMSGHISKEIYSGEVEFRNIRVIPSSPGEFSRICICLSSAHTQPHVHMLTIKTELPSPSKAIVSQHRSAVRAYATVKAPSDTPG
jgi:hypothetical protein